MFAYTHCDVEYIVTVYYDVLPDGYKDVHTIEAVIEDDEPRADFTEEIQHLYVKRFDKFETLASAVIRHAKEHLI
jgi:hypothetical protein